MSAELSLAQLVDGGVELQPHEAVAVAQRLIEHAHCGASHLSASPQAPGLRHVLLRNDGTIHLLARAVRTPEEVARLLRALLPAGAARVPAGLLYANARALRLVEAPGFSSLDEFARALARFEDGERNDVLRALAARARASAPERCDAPTCRRRITSWLAPAAVTVAAGLLLALALGTGPRSSGAGHDVQIAITTVTPGRPSGAPVDAARNAEPGGRDQDVVAPPRKPHSPRHGPRPVDAIDAGSGQTLVRALDTTRQVFSPAFDPSGALLFHTGGSADVSSALMMRPATGTALTKVLDDGAKNYHARPSPDGRLIAFDSDRDGARGVYLARADGTDVRRVSGAGYAAVPAWSPDGQWLTFVRAEPGAPRVWNLWLLSLDSGELRRLTRYRYGQTWGASWFEDGRRICFSHEDRLVVLDLAARQSRVYPSPVPRRLVRTPAVSPDGDHIVFQVRHSGVWVLDLRDNSMRRVLNDRTAEEFTWSPDGRRIAFHSRRNGRWEIWQAAARW